MMTTHDTKPRTVAIVARGGHESELAALTDVGDFDVVRIEPPHRAYSNIRRAAPDAVIVCLEFDDAECMQVLSMLKLDGATSQIPVITYLADHTAPVPVAIN